MGLKELTKPLNDLLYSCIHELEKYAIYVCQCLGKNVNLDDFVVVHFEKRHGTAMAMVYPKSCAVDGLGVVNPMFFYGFYIQMGERINDDLKLPIKVEFFETFEEMDGRD